jgi:hypothetical protein
MGAYKSVSQNTTSSMPKEHAAEHLDWKMQPKIKTCVQI